MSLSSKKNITDLYKWWEADRRAVYETIQSALHHAKSTVDGTKSTVDGTKSTVDGTKSTVYSTINTV